MYSVLIQNDRTIESFRQYRALFPEEMREGIGSCRWFESGESIDSALPTLRSMTNDREEWRAIIVCAGFNSWDNPFDIVGNREEGMDRPEEAEPLIRLTHMLGGVPEPEYEYEQEADSGGSGRRMVFTKWEQDETALEVTSALQDRYRFDGRLPSEIILIHLRQREKETKENELGKSIKCRRGAEAESFWQRNKYPSKCRFLIYDVHDEGPVGRDAEMFGFWMSVLLTAANRIPASSLQAYRLYQINAEIDRELLAECVRDRAVGLSKLRAGIDCELRTALELHFKAGEELPDYEMKVGVDMPQINDETQVPTADYMICDHREDPDRTRWFRQSGKVEEELSAVFRRAERSLEKSTSAIRTGGSVDEHDVTLLDSFGMEDMDEKLAQQCRRIIYNQNNLPGTRFKRSRKLAELKEAVNRELPLRINEKTAIIVAAIITGLVLTALVPSLVFALSYKIGGWKAALFLTVWLLFLFGAVLLAGLVIFRYRFTKKIRRYNKQVDEHITALFDASTQYCEYATDLVSYSRGCSYLDILDRKLHDEESKEDRLHRYYKAAGRMLDRLADWNTAFGLNISFEIETERNTFLETGDISAYDFLYYLGDGACTFTARFGEAGSMLESPYEFAQSMHFERLL